MSATYLGSPSNRVASWIKQHSTMTLPYIDFNTNYYGDSGDLGSVYFDTEIVPDENTGVEILVGRQQDPQETERGWQSGCRAYWIGNAMMLNYVAGSQRCWLIWNDGTTQLFVAPTTPADAILVSFMPNGVLAAGNAEVSADSEFDSNGESFYIGDINQSEGPIGDSDGQGSIRFFWAKFYQNGALTHHFVPETNGNDIYLRDVVTNQTIMPSTAGESPGSIAYGEQQLPAGTTGKNVQMAAFRR